jgi:proprotein convertase subtilisin/kexin type 5
MYFLHNQCFVTCPPGYFENTTARTCEGCLVPYCGNCSLGISTCSNCLTGTSTFLWLQQCLFTCPLSTYPEPLDWNCYPCDSSCYTCSNSTIYNCTSCVGIRYLFTPDHRCLFICPDGLWPNVTDNTCCPCIENCLKC